MGVQIDEVHPGPFFANYLSLAGFVLLPAEGQTSDLIHPIHEMEFEAFHQGRLDLLQVLFILMGQDYLLDAGPFRG